MQKGFIIGIIVIVIGLGIWYFSSSNGTTDIIANTTQTSSSSTSSADYTINLDEYSLSPSAIRVSSGEQVTVKLTNTGNVIHDYLIDDLSVNSGILEPGESKVITIPAASVDKTYEVYCSVGNHRALGMVGSFTVTQ